MVSKKSTLHNKKRNHKNKSLKRSYSQPILSIKKPVVVLCLVYANWCVHCAHLKPEWDKMEESLKTQHAFQDEQIVKIEDSDPHKYEKINQIHPNISIEGYPTIFKKYSNPSSVEYYRGERNANALQNWALQERNNMLYNGGYYSGNIKKKAKTKRTKTYSK
jgi:thiol-disulfide isomerase/thioredoxin